VELRHVERHVDETDGALPGQVDVLGRQRHGRVADRCRDLDPVALVRIGSSAMARMMRAAISSSLSADVDGTKTRTLRPPTHDDVRFAQRLAQPAGDGDENGIAGRVPEAVVRLLEEIDVDQQQRMHGESGSVCTRRSVGTGASRISSWKYRRL
jgi:hypothetical protein